MSRKLQNQARFERLVMANERALDEEENRLNRVDGRGTTQGGAYLKDGKVVTVPEGRMGATRFGSQMGKDMASHLSNLHGSGFAEDFLSGFTGALKGIAMTGFGSKKMKGSGFDPLPLVTGILKGLAGFGSNSEMSLPKGVSKATLIAMATGKSHHFTPKELRSLQSAGLVKDVSKYKKGFTGVLTGSGDASDHALLEGSGPIMDKILPVLTEAGIKLLQWLLEQYFPKEKIEAAKEVITPFIGEKEVNHPLVTPNKAVNRPIRRRGRGMAVEDESSSDDEIKGGYKSGAYEGLGKKPKAKRAPLSSSDPRRKRAELVRKIMNQRNISMIEASSYIKSNGLKY